MAHLTLTAIALAVAAPASSQTPAPAQPARPALCVCLQPLGPHDPQMVVAARRGIERLLGANTRILDARPLPARAFHPPRQRYRAERLLGYLKQDVRPGSGCDYVVGMTARDISTTKGDVPDWGVFGLGEMPGPVAVVSTCRLRGGPATARQVAMRVIKVVNHELGHNLGLDHCATRRCLMEDARGTIKTVDAETGLLCQSCRSRLGGLAPATSIEWKALLLGIH